MEIIFILTSLILSILIFKIITILTGYKSLRAAFGCNNEILVLYSILMCFLLALVFFVTLCAMNNTFWKINYIFY